MTVKKTRGYGWGRRIAIAATLALGTALTLAGPARSGQAERLDVVGPALTDAAARPPAGRRIPAQLFAHRADLLAALVYGCLADLSFSALSGYANAHFVAETTEPLFPQPYGGWAFAVAIDGAVLYAFDLLQACPLAGRHPPGVWCGGHVHPAAMARPGGTSPADGRRGRPWPDGAGDVRVASDQGRRGPPGLADPGPADAGPGGAVPSAATSGAGRGPPLGRPRRSPYARALIRQPAAAIPPHRP